MAFHASYPSWASDVTSRGGTCPDDNLRAAWLLLHCHNRAASRTVSPLGAPSGSGDDRRRPSRLPCRLALAMPAWTRSRIRSRSNCANAPSKCNWSRPAGVVVSMDSPSDVKETPRLEISSIKVMR